MTALTAADFPAFFREVYGHDPFPWQTKLAEQVMQTGWPPGIAMPTASGKTAAIDVAVFAMAAETPAARPRRQPRRIFFVVDRRIVVDEAHERAQRLAATLRTARSGVARTVADRLRALGGDSEPLATAVLRGGIYRDDAWARSPAQPTVVVSTVDQVGSRLLFRGYGLSPYRWPIHAGLVGNDALIVVDEAHCARPFTETLEWVAHYRGPNWASKQLDLPFEVVAMTATPLAGEPLRPGKADLAHPVLGRRLSAAKPARLVSAKKGDAGFATTATDLAVELASEPRAIAVVVNRVATARAVLEALASRVAAGKLDADLLLLTGRVRPLERDSLVAEHGGRLRSDPERPAPERTLIAVATQCIEVGADFDFDAMVTECAPLDSLRQRFGRLNRLGRHPSAPAAVVMRPEAEKGDDPIYGDAMLETWRWLEAEAGESAELDFGVNALELLLAAAPEGPAALLARLGAPATDAPMMLPAHCDLWAQTSPAPHVWPDPAAYLHGVGRAEADVQLVWRADLPREDLAAWTEIVALCPPGSGESMSVPIYAARAWLDGRLAPPVADFEGVAPPEEKARRGEQPTPGMARKVLRWRGPESEETEVVGPEQIRPGDTLVVPSVYGGCDRFGWNPASGHPVPDLGDLTQALRRRAVLRLHPSIVADWGHGDFAPPEIARQLAKANEPPEADEDREALEVLAATAELPDWLRGLCSHLALDRRRKVARHPSGTGLVFTSAKLLSAGAISPDFTDEDLTASAGTREIGLDDHLEHVRAQAAAFAAASGLGPESAFDCELAARLHDLGKTDPRFQLWMHAGDPIAAARSGEPLAKSGGAPRTPRTLAATRKLSGYPAGGRHELVSVRLVEQARELLAKASDPELVLHLIASHHGRCRPFAPVVLDPAPASVGARVDGAAVTTSSDTGLERIDSGVAARYWQLVERYGWWGLAWLEALVRLSDHRASQAEQEERP